MAKWYISFLSCWLALMPGATLAQSKTLADSALHFFRIRSGVSYATQRWQVAIDSALAIDSTVATLWQWKGMPYFKDGDYEEGMRCYANAVRYDSVNYLPLRAFMKSVFVKDYEGGIEDFMVCEQRGYGVGLMDHSYDFFIGLSYKQLGDLDSADKYISRAVNERVKSVGENWVHWNEWFYMGMIAYEKEDYKNAIRYYDKCLKEFHNNPEALFYKARSLAATGKAGEARPFFQQAIDAINEGTHSTEDSDIYVNFPDRVFLPDIKLAMKQLYGEPVKN